MLCGTEINSIEEVHALAYFPTLEKLAEFQAYLDHHLPNIKNDPDKFGYQVVVDAEEQITYEEERLLISALDVDINTIEPVSYTHLNHNIPKERLPCNFLLTLPEKTIIGIYSLT